MFVCFYIKCFYIASFYHYFFVSKIQKHIKKIENQKVWLTLLNFVSKYVLPCTSVLMALCIYERSLFPLHLYHCRRNFDIYVIVVNRSSNLSWLISKWFCWSWDMHRLVPIYLPTLLFIFFLLLLKELIKCKSPNEKRYWAAKICRTY